KASDIFDETSKTIGNVFRQTMKSTQESLDNIDWKDIDYNLNIPRKVQSEFDHECLFEDTTATILDFKNANGNIQFIQSINDNKRRFEERKKTIIYFKNENENIKFKPSVNDNIKVSAKIKFYGKVEEATPLAAFEARSIINIDEDKFTFHIPNKNIVADMIIY